MIFLCFFMMRGRRETMVSGFGCCGRDWRRAGDTDSASDILDKRYASGEIDQAEYEAKKKMINGQTGADKAGNKSNGGTER